MIFTTDSSFVIGNMHLNQGTPCQDYALSGVDNSGWVPCAYAVLSDGCSSGARTEVGASIMTLAVESAIKHGRHRQESMQDARNDSIDCAQGHLGLCRGDMLATCVSTLVTSEGAYALVEGDGIVAIKWHDGRTDLHKFNWEGNAPWYPIYHHDPNLFINNHGGDRKACRLTEEWWRYESGEHRVRDIIQHPILFGIHGIPIFIHETHLPEVECVAIFSDGICQIDGMDWRDAAVELLAFKNTAGDFVKRRMNAFAKGAVKSGRKHQDDLSMAVVKIHHE